MFNRADGRSTGTTIVAGDQYHIGLGFGHAGCNRDRKSTRLNSSHSQISYAVFCLKKKISLEQFFLAYTHLWPQVTTNKKVGVMWPNDADGNEIRGVLGPLLTGAGYTIVDSWPYEV